MNKKGDIQIFSTWNGKTEIQVKLENETVWLNSYQMSDIFWIDRSTIEKHIKNIYISWELKEEWTCAKNAQVQIEWKRKVTRIKNFYNLDLILSVWYRVNSKEATQFRIWSSNILKEYLIKGYSINGTRLQETWLEELNNSINLIHNALNSWDLSKDEALGLLDIITNYTNSWVLLQKYDENNLSEEWNTEVLNYKLEAQEAYSAILQLKNDLVNKWEATDLFAKKKADNTIEWIFWNIYQTFDWVDLYQSIEEKAAHLLYFIIKDHPFADGNKRSWAFTFILFLSKNNILLDDSWNKKINDRALVAITLLIASSDPKDKELMIKLVINLIN
jgi:prophage maintenance system killer protein